MHRFAIAVLQVGIVAAILFALFGQVVIIPGAAAEEVDRFPPYAPYATPYVTVAIVGVACAQVVLVAVWMLLGLVRREEIFTPAALRWVDTIIWSTIAATMLAFGVVCHLAVADIPEPPYNDMATLSAILSALACVGVGGAFAMVVVIVRNLRRKALDRRNGAAALV